MDSMIAVIRSLQETIYEQAKTINKLELKILNYEFKMSVISTPKNDKKECRFFTLKR